MSQYAVTDYSRSFGHGEGVPGIFFKYDLEAMSLTIRERTTTLYQFLIRLVGVVGELNRYSSYCTSWTTTGGVWTVAAFSLRVLNRAQKEMTKVASVEKEYIPSAISNKNGYYGQGSPEIGITARATSWMGNRGNSGEIYRNFKGR